MRGEEGRGPYTGLRVLDAADGVAGAMAAMYLADFGAEVVKVDSGHRWPPADEPGWLCWDRNKALVRLDRRTAAGRHELRRLVGAADVAVFDQVPGELEDLGLDATTCVAANDRLVHAWLPPYGVAGRWSRLPDDPLLLAAVSGVCDYHLATEEVPVAPVVPVLSYAHGGLGATAVGAALLERERSGRGQGVTVSGLHAVAAMQACVMAGGEGVVRPMRKGSFGLPNYRLYQCRDGQWLYLGALTQPFFLTALEVLGSLDVMAMPGVDGDFAQVLNPAYSEDVAQRLQERFAERDRAEWLAALDAAAVPNAPVCSREEWFASETVAVNGLRQRLEHPLLGTVDLPGLAVHLQATPGSVRHLPGSERLVPSQVWPEPLTAGGRNGSGGDGVAPDNLHEAAGAGGRALEGLRVLDASSFVAGTFGPMLLADYGADVVKVEPPDGDPYRLFSLAFMAINQRKRGVALDLKAPGDLSAYLGLAARADVVVDNLRPATAGRLGVDYASLARRNDRLVHCSVSAFGTRGTWAPRRGFDPLVQALSGLVAAQGGDDSPSYSTMLVHDIGGGTTAAFGVLAALFARERSGRGQSVQISLAGVSVMLQSGELVSYRGRPPTPVGGRDFPGPRAGHRLYRCRDGWIGLATRTPEHMTQLLEALGLAEAAGGRAASLLWAPGDGVLAGRIGDRLGQLSTEEALDLLGAAVVPAAPVLSRHRAIDDPWLNLNRFYHVVDDPVFGRCTLVRTFAEWTRSDGGGGPMSPSAPAIGQHTDEVLSELEAEAAEQPGGRDPRLVGTMAEPAPEAGHPT